jgi:hypothetical protein
VISTLLHDDRVFSSVIKIDKIMEIFQMDYTIMSSL